MFLLTSSEKQFTLCHRRNQSMLFSAREIQLLQMDVTSAVFTFFLLYGQNYSPSIKPDPKDYPEVLKLNGSQEIPDDLSVGNLRHLIGINTSTLDFMEMPKSHSNLKDFGLRQDNKLLLIQVHQYVLSRVEGGF